MCHRIVPVQMDELQMALDLYATTGHARIPKDNPVPKDVYPGAKLAAVVKERGGTLKAQELIWGFASTQPKRQGRVFNTRIETALSQLQEGYGMWVNPITRGRCLVPVRAFYESWTEPGSPAPDGKVAVRFTSEGHRIFLLAAVMKDGEVSIVTCPPNGDVGPVHSRMPLVLGPGESSIWLGPGFPKLADRSQIHLAAETILPPQKG